MESTLSGASGTGLHAKLPLAVDGPGTQHDTDSEQLLDTHFDYLLGEYIGTNGLLQFPDANFLAYNDDEDNEVNHAPPQLAPAGPGAIPSHSLSPKWYDNIEYPNTPINPPANTMGGLGMMEKLTELSSSLRKFGERYNTTASDSASSSTTQPGSVAKSPAIGQSSAQVPTTSANLTKAWPPSTSTHTLDTEIQSPSQCSTALATPAPVPSISVPSLPVACAESVTQRPITTSVPSTPVPPTSVTLTPPARAEVLQSFPQLPIAPTASTPVPSTVLGRAEGASTPQPPATPAVLSATPCPSIFTPPPHVPAQAAAATASSVFAYSPAPSTTKHGHVGNATHLPKVTNFGGAFQPGKASVAAEKKSAKAEAKRIATPRTRGRGAGRGRGFGRGRGRGGGTGTLKQSDGADQETLITAEAQAEADAPESIKTTSNDVPESSRSRASGPTRNTFMVSVPCFNYSMY